MGPLLIALAFAVWLVAAYGFVRVAYSWFRLMGMAPKAERFQTALDLGFWNFERVESRLGPPSLPLTSAYRRGFALFFVSVLGFMALTIVNIISGNAA